MQRKNHLVETFQRLRDAFPRKVIGSTPVGSGNFGIVVEHEDRTLRKFMFRPDDIAYLSMLFDSFYREAQVLAVFNHVSSAGLDLPILVENVEELYHDNFAATYRMTKIEGCGWADISTPDRSLFKNAGRLVARFHRIEADDIPKISDKQNDATSRIVTLPGILNDKKNRALEIVDDYLQGNRKPGLLHGDLGLHNMIYQNGLPTGIVDFSYTGISDNNLSDFAAFENHMDDFIDGYEIESGHRVDRHAVIATQLSMEVNNLLALSHYKATEPEWILNSIENINMHLNNMIYITGYKP